MISYLLKQAYQYLIESFELFDSPTYNLIFMLVVGLVSFSVAWSVVGRLLDGDWISGGDKASMAHWCIRIFASVVIYYIVATGIRSYQWFEGIISKIV